MDAVLAAEPIATPLPASLRGRRVLAPSTLVLDQAEPLVLSAFAAAVARLRTAGMVVEEAPLDLLMEIPRALAKCSFAASEAFAMWRDVFAAHADEFDPRIRERIAGGGRMLAADYVDLLRARARLIREADSALEPYDAILAPTAVMVPPPIEPLEASEALFHKVNALALRNTSLFNFLDRCAISIPCTDAASPPVGLMVVGKRMQDRHLLSLARGIELQLASV
jgi:aspartyl-tRNA(Asn)/glutamyl-tRNA(Gln) amidotransferase subunit A